MSAGKLYSVAGLAGCVEQRRSRTTGRAVSAYHCEQARLDPAAGRWATVCEDHGHIVNHVSLALARGHLGYPVGWCETCSREAAE